MADVGGVDGADGDVDVVGDAAGMVEGAGHEGPGDVGGGRGVTEMFGTGDVSAVAGGRILMLSTGETLAELLNSVQ